MSRRRIWVAVRGSLCTLSAALIALTPAVSADELKVISARDTLRINSVGAPVFSPDGEWILYTQGERDLGAEIDLDEDYERTTHVWRARHDGSQRRQLTFGDKDATSPRWLDNPLRVAFLSARGESKGDGDGEGPKSQVYFMYFDGGEAWQVTTHEEGVRSFEISPDGSQIAFLAQDALTDEEKKKKKDKDDAIVVDEEHRWTHLHLWDVEAGESKRLTEGDFTASDPHFAPDGSAIAYTARRSTSLDDSWDSDVYVVDVESAESRVLHTNPGSDTGARFSPDGKSIAFASRPQVKTNTYYNDLLVVEATGGEPKTYLADFDRDFSTPIWSADSAEIFWSTGDRATTRLFAVELASGDVRSVDVPEGGNFGYDLSSDGRRWAWLHSESTEPMQVFAADASFEQTNPVSDANPWLDEEGYKRARQERVTWKNSEGQEIEGVLTYPVGYEEGQRYPFILNPHGGPSGAVTTSWNTGNQFLAGNGFMVLQPNFRGSSNYGQEFLNANRNEWGRRDYDDCMTGVDYAIDQGWADPDRLVAYGWSYGGYMTFWISTQTDRFKVISPGAGLSNLYSMYSTTDISNYLGWFFGTPWDNEEIYRQLSPIRHAKNVTSDILIMTGAEDARVPPSQSTEFYRALKDLDKNVELVVYPREGHGIREPRHQMDRLRRYLDAFSAGVGLEARSEKAWLEALAAAKADEDGEGDSASGDTSSGGE